MIQNSRDFLSCFSQSELASDEILKDHWSKINDEMKTDDKKKLRKERENENPLMFLYIIFCF